MKKITSFLLAVLLLFSTTLLSSCISGTVAIGLIESSSDNYSHLAFYSLNGKCEIKCKNAKYEKAKLYFASEVEQGELNLYYSVNNEKVLLATVKAGEPVKQMREDITFNKNQTVIIYVETVSKSQVGVVVVQLIDIND